MGAAPNVNTTYRNSDIVGLGMAGFGLESFLNLHPRFQRFVSCLLAALVIGFAGLHWQDLRDSLAEVHTGWCLAGLGVFYINYFLRAIRLKTLLPGRLTVWPDGIWIACFHGTTTYLFPMRTGELTLPVLLKNHYGLDLTSAGRVLVKARLLDLASLGYLTTLAAVFLQSVPISPTFRVVWVGAGGAMVLFPASLRWLTRFSGWERLELLRKIVAFGRISRFRPNEMLASLGVWLAISGALYCTSRAIHLPIGLGGVLFLVTIQLPLQLLPVQGFANTGNHEWGWVVALSLLGIPGDEGLRFALTSHALILIYVLAISPVLLLARFFGHGPVAPEKRPTQAPIDGRKGEEIHPYAGGGDDDRSR
jgi:hypothetical protein